VALWHVHYCVRCEFVHQYFRVVELLGRSEIVEGCEPDGFRRLTVLCIIGIATPFSHLERRSEQSKSKILATSV
jgi:hypothetical protein